MGPKGSSPCSQQPAFVMILNQINAVNAFEVVPFVQVSPPKLCMYLSPSPYVPHVPPIYSIRPCCGHPNIWQGVQIMKLFTMQFSPSFCNSLLSGPNTSGSTLFSNTLSPVPPLTRQTKSHTHKTRPAKLQFSTF